MRESDRERLRERAARLRGQPREQVLPQLRKLVRDVEDELGVRKKGLPQQVRCEDCGWEARWLLRGERGARLRNRPCERCGGRMRLRSRLMGATGRRARNRRPV